MSDKKFDQKGSSAQEGRYGQASPRARRIFSFFVLLFWPVIIGYYVFNLNFYRTIDCTVVSAEAVGGGGGLRSSSSRQSINTETEECGLVVFTKMRNEGFDTAQDLADELNRHQGEKLTFRVSYLHLGPYTARAVELEGFPIRD